VDSASGDVRIERRRSVIAVAIVFLDGIGFGLVLPLLPFVVLAYKGSPSVVAGLVGVYALAGFVGGLLAGTLSDRLGRLSLVRLTLCGSIVAYGGMALATVLPGLFLFRGLSGLMTGRGAVVRAAATDRLSGSKHVQTIGNLTAATALGSALGPGLASVVGLISGEGATHFRAVFFLAMALSALSLVLVQIGWPIAEREASPQKTLRDRPAHGRWASLVQVWPWLLLSFLGSYAYSTVLSITALFSHATFGWTTVEVGWLLVLVATALALARSTAIPWIAARLGSEKAQGVFALLGAASLIATGTATTVVQFVCGLVLVSLGAVGVTMLSTAAVSRNAAPVHRGFLFGVSQGLSAIALFIGSTVNGLLFEHLGHGAPHLAAAAILCLALPVLWIAGATSRTAVTV
jgi:DHA1 family tetracycline resistance protein-like MFS transporter